MRLGKRIIDKAEQSRILQEYTTLNDDFTKRLQDENRESEKRETGDKRPMVESPQHPRIKNESTEVIVARMKAHNEKAAKDREKKRLKAEEKEKGQ